MACVSSVLQYNGTTNTKSKPTFVLPGNRLLLNNMFIFITCLFAPLCVCVCVFFSFCLFALLCATFVSCYLFCLSVGLMFLFLLHVHAWSEGTTSEMESKKGEMQAKRCKPKLGNVQHCRRFSLPEWFSLSF